MVKILYLLEKILMIGISKQEMEELRREFKDTQLPDPEMYPQSFLYCVKVLRTLKELKYGSVS